MSRAIEQGATRDSGDTGGKNVAHDNRKQKCKILKILGDKREAGNHETKLLLLLCLLLVLPTITATATATATALLLLKSRNERGEAFFDPSFL
uniref:Uncharacterized protein n=1 Tax=Vespula pensylvanica TaxID=30213 RepID=A0A834P231_VESPE|nr:hypothetical protein H0235_007900 [Vespula pensylvanica]